MERTFTLRNRGPERACECDSTQLVDDLLDLSRIITGKFGITEAEKI